MGERRPCKAEVNGSIPFSSTFFLLFFERLKCKIDILRKQIGSFTEVKNVVNYLFMYNFIVYNSLEQKTLERIS